MNLFFLKIKGLGRDFLASNILSRVYLIATGLLDYIGFLLVCYKWTLTPIFTLCKLHMYIKGPKHFLLNRSNSKFELKLFEYAVIYF